MFFEILRNIAILLAFCMVYSLLFQSRDRNSLSGRCWLGIIFGFAGVLAMLTPTALFPGVLIDSRSVFISMAGLFGGWISALIAAGISLVCRIILGGPGAPVGCGIILTSAGVGAGYHYLRRKNADGISNLQFWMFGMVVHLIMIGLMPALPMNIRWEVIHLIAIPVLLIYPASTVLVGRLLTVQEEQFRSKRLLAENQERLSSILRVVPTGIGMVKDRVITDLNPRISEITGYTYDELIGENARILYPSEEEYLRVGREKYEQIRTHGTGMVETQWQRKDGSIRDILLSSTPLHASDLSVGVTFTALDITDRKQMENALWESVQKLKLHVEQTPLAIVRWDMNFRVVEWNRAAEQIFGFTRREAIGKHGSFILPEHTKESVSHVWEQLLADSGGSRSTNENITRDGRIILCDWYNIPLLDDAGKVFGVASQVMDVTERRKIEKERDQLMLAIEQSAEIVVITDAEANIQYVNRAFENVTGYGREEAIGKNPRFLQSGQHSAAFYQKMWNTLTSGKPWAGQLFNKKKDGSIYTEDATISPVCGPDGTVVSYVAAKRDVTHELELEDQLRQAQKMEAVGQMAGGIAHDFNNLLQMIGGYAELSLMDVDQNNSCIPALNEIQEATFRGKELVSQLLAFSRRQVIRPVDLNLNTVIERLLQMIRRMIGEHIELDFIAGRNLGTIHADHGLMEQVLLNLCVNARDAMPDGGKITVETEDVLIDEEYARMHTWASPGRYVLLSVTDSGCGMDQRTMEHIFEPFFTTKDVGKGTGLGLSTVFGIVEQHKGHVNAYSEPDKGTIFKIYLPTVEREASEVSHKPADPVSGGTETLLVAEDNKVILKLAEHLLTEAGYTVLTACDGEEAVERFKEHADEIDGAIFDVVMPRLGGKQAMEQIFELRPGLPHLFTSGYNENAVHTNFIQQRGLHLLSKPYQAEMLLRKIREVLDEKKTES